MFGYIICNKSGLSEEEFARYRRFYCGVCKSLEKKFGQMGQFCLSFDMTFLALFLSSMYEPEERRSRFLCPAHPVHKREAVEQEFTEYAADMTVALSYHKCLDDWADEKKSGKRLYGKLLEKHYEGVKLRYPKQCSVIEESLKELMRLEKEAPAEVDAILQCSGKMLSEVFVYREDFWSNSLREFGYALGRFIYLMDAAMDYEKDKKKKNYNPLFFMDKQPEDAEELLTMLIGDATQIYEKLPMVQDAHLIGNILYGGVWQQYYTKIKEKKDGNGSV
ncbi:MAG: hypothetical protein IJZ55_11780 [Lachnospiraceae bacterium]|nr:hypothetical protein [Lachnospiraceae bacterium]